MSNIGHLPTAPLSAAQRAVALHARNITTITAATPANLQPAADVIPETGALSPQNDLASEIVGLMRARQGFRASAALLIAAQQRDETLLDIVD